MWERCPCSARAPLLLSPSSTWARAKWTESSGVSWLSQRSIGHKGAFFAYFRQDTVVHAEQLVAESLYSPRMPIESDGHLGLAILALAQNDADQEVCIFRELRPTVAPNCVRALLVSLLERAAAGAIPLITVATPRPRMKVSEDFLRSVLGASSRGLHLRWDAEAVQELYGGELGSCRRAHR